MVICKVSFLSSALSGFVYPRKKSSSQDAFPTQHLPSVINFALFISFSPVVFGLVSFLGLYGFNHTVDCAF